MIAHKQLASWYAQLSQHLEAGVVLADALRWCEGPPVKSRRALADRIQNGDTIESALRGVESRLPQADRCFLIAAAETGKLPSALHNLADRHERTGASQLKVMLGLLYPLGVFHLAALLLPVIRMIDYNIGFQWDTLEYVTQVLALLVPVWALIGFIYYLAHSDHPLLPRLLRCLPLLRKYSRMQALSDIAYSLATFIAAGVPAPNAWRLAVRLSNDPRFALVLQRLEPVFAQGGEPAEVLQQFKCFPPEFRTAYQTGAKNGKLDSNLMQAGRQFQQQANTAMTLAAVVYPSLMFAIVATIIIVTIFRVYGNYLNIFSDFLTLI